MLTLKITSIIIVFVIALIKDFWSDTLKVHVRTKQVLLFLMSLAAIIGIATTVLDDEKSRETARVLLDHQTILQTQNDSLRTRVDSLIRITQQGEVKFDRQNTILQARVSELNSKLEPFVKIAVTKYPDFDIQTALSHLAKDVEEAKEMAKPATLSPYTKDISKSDAGFTLKLHFQPSKNAPLGLIDFSANLPANSKAKITDFWPSTDGGAFQSGRDSKQIAPDGKSARLRYSLLGSGFPTFELKVSQQTEVTITGNYLPTPVKVLIR